MSSAPELRTERLVLRDWRDEDLDPFAALNSDPEVMRFMPKLLSRDECATRIQQIRDHFRDLNARAQERNAQQDVDRSAAPIVQIGFVTKPDQLGPELQFGPGLVKLMQWTCVRDSHDAQRKS